jgi:hypothetical protein
MLKEHQYVFNISILSTSVSGFKFTINALICKDLFFLVEVELFLVEVELFFIEFALLGRG